MRIFAVRRNSGKTCLIAPRRGCFLLLEAPPSKRTGAAAQPQPTGPHSPPGDRRTCSPGGGRANIRRKAKFRETLYYSTPVGGAFLLEAPPGIGPGMKVLQTSALPLGYGALFFFWKNGYETCFVPVRWSGLRGSNPPPPPWQGGALPNELNPRNGASGRNRTNDTGIFSPLLYQLSYRGIQQGLYFLWNNAFAWFFINGDPDGGRTHDL